MISRIKKDIFIVIELINPKNVSFLYNKGRDQNDEYRFIRANINIDGTASFAAGEVYFSSIMDNLITQAYYNPSLLAVLKKLILGEDQSVYKKTPLSKYKEIVSANLYLIDMPNDEKKYETENTTRGQEHDFFMKKPLFKEIFQYFSKQKVIVIGVYRAMDSPTYVKNNTFSYFLNRNSYIGSNFYYVVTSPDPNFELNPKDKLFVLSQTFPDDDHMFNEVKKDYNMGGDEEYLKQVENGQFIKVKKSEEKKENPKVLDQEGERKIKEVNISLRETLDYLRGLKGNINNAKERIHSVVPDLIKNKINSLNNDE